MHICVNCGFNKTYIYKGREYWRKHNNNWYCKKCYNKLIDNIKWHEKYNSSNNKKWNPINNPINNSKRVSYKGKQINVGIIVRKGMCLLCEKLGKTHLHHINYHDNDPLKDTIELCPRCHKQQHKK